MKTLLQTSSRGEYRGAWHCFSAIVRDRGVFGLFRGMAAPLATIAPTYALVFAGYSIGQRITRPQDADGRPVEQLVRIGLAGSVTALFSTPL